MLVNTISAHCAANKAIGMSSWPLCVSIKRVFSLHELTQSHEGSTATKDNSKNQCCLRHHSAHTQRRVTARSLVVVLNPQPCHGDGRSN